MNRSREDMRIKALIVGVNNYIDSEPLRYAVNDATSVKELLEKMYDQKDIILIADSLESRFTPLGNNILANIEILSKTAEEDDNIFFYFAGHGRDVNGEPALLSSDYRDEVGLKASIRIEDVKKTFEESKAKFKLLILDSCHSGAEKGREKSGYMSRSMFDAISDVPEGFVIISACDLNQISFEDEKLEHGVFTSYLLEGLEGKADANGDKEVTVHELYDYITPRVKNYVFREYRTSQIPHMRSNFGGIYVVNRLPEETVESKDTFGAPLFHQIWLTGENHQMKWVDYEDHGIEPDIEDALQKAKKNTLLVLRKTYGISGLKAGPLETVFEDGKVLQIINSDERRNETELSISVYFRYYKKVWSKIDNVILELDDLKNTWKKIQFITKKKFDFDKIEELCNDNNYEILDFSVEKPRFIEFETDFFSDKSNEVSIFLYDNYSRVSVSPSISYYLDEHFYPLINPRKTSELCASLILE
jgi:hypothetical protein